VRAGNFSFASELAFSLPDGMFLVAVAAKDRDARLAFREGRVSRYLSKFPRADDVLLIYLRLRVLKLLHSVGVVNGGCEVSCTPVDY
jgi:hypothetical protein